MMACIHLSSDLGIFPLAFRLLAFFQNKEGIVTDAYCCCEFNLIHTPALGGYTECPHHKIYFV